MEVVGGLLAAEQVVSTSVEAGALGAYAIRKPTLPLRGTLKQIATSPDDVGSDSLARFGHTIAFLHDDVYIFGGQVSQNELAGNELHILKLGNLQSSGPDYRAVPALPSQEGDDVPCARTGHTLVAVDDKLLLFGGYSDIDRKTPIDENGRVWIFDPTTTTWSYVEPLSEKIPALHSHAAVTFERSMIIHGGCTDPAAPPTTDTWQFSISSHSFTKLPSAPSHEAPATSTPQAPPNFTIVDNHLYLISHSSSLDNAIHSLKLMEEGGPTEWVTAERPTNPLTPGARPRRAGGVVPVTTGTGRNYLLLILGAKEESANSAHRSVAAKDDDVTATNPSANAAGAPAVQLEEAPEAWSDIWALQLPSSTKTVAAAKDVARSKLGLDDHVYEWAEVDIQTPDADVKNMIPGSEGKQHPGPRSWLACTPINGQKVLFWGGLGPKGNAEGDGWLLDIKEPEGETDGILGKIKKWTGMDS